MDQLDDALMVFFVDFAAVVEISGDGGDGGDGGGQ